MIPLFCVSFWSPSTGRFIFLLKSSHLSWTSIFHFIPWPPVSMPTWHVLSLSTLKNYEMDLLLETISELKPSWFFSSSPGWEDGLSEVEGILSLASPLCKYTWVCVCLLYPAFQDYLSLDFVLGFTPCMFGHSRPIVGFPSYFLCFQLNICSHCVCYIL